MSKRQIPERSIVPGLLSGIDYAELIKRDSSTVSETMGVSKGSKVKTKTFSVIRNKKIN